MTGKITITFLGTGSAIPSKERFQVSTALRHDHGLILFDCGEGTQYQIRKFGISLRKELIICISHLHSDHFLGLPGLLASLQLQEYKGKLTIIGPEYIETVINNLINANMVRIDFPIEIFEISEKLRFEHALFTISCIEAIHEGNAVSYVWRENDKPGKINKSKLEDFGIELGPDVGELQAGHTIKIDNRVIKPEEVMGKSSRGRVIAYSGDTSPNKKFAEYLKNGCDVLIHEATYPSDMEVLAIERNHSTFSQAAKIANIANVGHLYLTHLSPRINDVAHELEIASKFFSKTTVAFDGLQIQI